MSASKEKTPSAKDRTTQLEGEIALLKVQNQQMVDSANEAFEDIYKRLWDLHRRLQKFENHEKAQNNSAQAQLNSLDSRVAELERPENPEDEAK